MSCEMEAKDPFDAVKRARAIEAAKRRDSEEERAQRTALFKAVEEVARFTGPADLVEFSAQWAPLWWRMGEQVRTAPEVWSIALSLPDRPEYDLAANLLDRAIVGKDLDHFAVELRETVLFLSTDDRVDALREIFTFLTAYLRSNTAQARQVELERNLDKLRLNPTDKVILSGLLKDPSRRMLGPLIAEQHGYEIKSIGKNLRKLVLKGLLESEKRQGYLLTGKGVKAARAISLLSP